MSKRSIKTAIDWTIVDGTHIRKACESYDSDPSLRPIKKAINTFLLLNNKKYPAKFIRKQAYQVATGNTLNPSTDYSGGIETVRFFVNPGFNTVYNGKILNGNQSQTRKSKEAIGKIESKN